MPLERPSSIASIELPPYRSFNHIPLSLPSTDFASRHLGIFNSTIQIALKMQKILFLSPYSAI